MRKRNESCNATRMARGGSSCRRIEERRVLRRLPLTLWYLIDRTRHPQRPAKLLDVLPDPEVLLDAIAAERELVAKKKVECIAAGGDLPKLAPADE